LVSLPEGKPDPILSLTADLSNELSLPALTVDVAFFDIFRIQIMTVHDSRSGPVAVGI